MNLHLTSYFWKSLAGEPLDMNDLKAIDLYAVQAIKEMHNTKNTISKEEFELYSEQTYVTRLSDGSDVDLVKGGKDKPVLHEDIDNFCELQLSKRLGEGEK